MSIMNCRLVDVLERHKILQDTQYGFRPNRCANHAAFVLQHTIYHYKAQHKPLFTAFLDISQAYDSVNHDLLMHIMKKVGLPQHFISLIQHVYSHASFCVSTDEGTSEQQPYTRGLKQGCPISPTLFNIFFAPTHAFLRHHHPQLGADIGMAHTLQAIYYADDVVLVAASLAQLQALVSTFNSFCNKLGLAINTKPGKSNVVVFNTTRTYPPLSLPTGVITHASQYTYLGVIFKSNMTWGAARKYRDTLAEAATRNVLSRFRTKDISNMFCACNIFNAQVMAPMLYGCEIWGWEPLNNWHWFRNDFQSRQAKVLRAALRIKSAPNMILMLECGLWPLMMYAGKRMVDFIFQLPYANSDVLDHICDMDNPYHTFNHFFEYTSKYQGMTLEGYYISLVHQLKQELGHPRDPSCRHIKMASYLHHIWNGQLHARPPFYKLDLSFNTYRTTLHARMHSLNIPAYMDHHKPLSDRICPLCVSRSPYDLYHLLIECPHFAGLRYHYLEANGIHTDSMHALFCSKNFITQHYIHKVLKTFHEFRNDTTFHTNRVGQLTNNIE